MTLYRLPLDKALDLLKRFEARAAALEESAETFVRLGVAAPNAHAIEVLKDGACRLRQNAAELRSLTIECPSRLLDGFEDVAEVELPG